MNRSVRRSGAIGWLLLRWGPPFVWMGVASLLSSDGFSAQQTGRYLIPLLHWLLPGISAETVTLLHAAMRKGMHVAEFAVLACLWYRALKWGEPGWRPQAAVRAFVLAAAFGALDETHQVFEPDRTASILDVGWDGLGAFLGLGGGWILQSRDGTTGRANADGGIPPGGVWLR